MSQRPPLPIRIVLELDARADASVTTHIDGNVRGGIERRSGGLDALAAMTLSGGAEIAIAMARGASVDQIADRLRRVFRRHRLPAQASDLELTVRNGDRELTGRATSAAAVEALTALASELLDQEADARELP